MGSRAAILCSRRSVFHFSSPSTSLIRAFSALEHCQSYLPNDLTSPPANTHPTTNDSYFSLAVRDGIPALLLPGFLSHNSFRYSNVVPGQYLGSSFGSSCFSQSLCYTSTATAGQPRFPAGNDENHKQTTKQVKEASPEDCDEAVEDLTEAKAQTKQAQQSQKSAKSIMQKLSCFKSHCFYEQTGLRSFVIGRMNLKLQCNITGWVQSFCELM